MSKHLDDLKAEAERLEGEIFTREQRIYVRLVEAVANRQNGNRKLGLMAFEYIQGSAYRARQLTEQLIHLRREIRREIRRVEKLEGGNDLDTPANRRKEEGL